MSSNKSFVCVNFYFDKTIACLRKFEETFANHSHIYVSFGFTQITQNPAESFLPMFLPVLSFLPITVPKADELDTNFTETFTKWNPNRVARAQPQFRLETVVGFFHLEVIFRF